MAESNLENMKADIASDKFSATPARELQVVIKEWMDQIYEARKALASTPAGTSGSLCLKVGTAEKRVALFKKCKKVSATPSELASAWGALVGLGARGSDGEAALLVQKKRKAFLRTVSFTLACL